MGFFDAFKDLFKKADDMEGQVKDLVEKADSLTDMIPGDADDKLVDGIKQQVENVTNTYDEVKKNLPGN